MQKTKLGVSVGMLGAAMYLMGLFSGYMVVVLMAGYVLLFEENEWLKKCAVKAVALMVFFSFLITAINLIPNAIGLIDAVLAVFGGSFSITVLSYLVSAVVSAIDIIEKILFLALGIKALGQGTVAVPVVDKLIDTYMG